MTARCPAIERVLFVPASGPEVGGGHVMRCLTLGEALARRGVVSQFSASKDGEALIRRFGNGAFEVDRTPLAAGLSDGRFGAVVVDDYGLSIAEEADFRKHVRIVAAIDDLADRPHEVDLLIDPGFNRVATDYDDWLPYETVRLIGPKFALVRRSFVALREAALAKPLLARPKRLFVSFGLSDIDGVAARCFAAIRKHYPKIEIDLALASDAMSVSILEDAALNDDRVHLHFDATHVAELMAEADIAIGAGGASTWERCCLGLPTLAVIVADNQRDMIQSMAKDGRLLAVDLLAPAFEAKFMEALRTIQAHDVRSGLRARSVDLCDGRGADRIADILLAL